MGNLNLCSTRCETSEQDVLLGPRLVLDMNESPTVGEEKKKIFVEFFFFNKLGNILVIHVFEYLIKNYYGSTITGSILVFLIN
jgi:hypothetical protein